MTSLIDKIEILIKREKKSPSKTEPNKSSSEILSELFGAFNADPPKIDEAALKKSKKSKKKHKKEKKKRSRSTSSSSDSDSDYSNKHKKKKKSKSKKRKDKDRSASRSRSCTPDLKPNLELLKNIVKQEQFAIKEERDRIKNEPKVDRKKKVSIKYEDEDSKPSFHNIIDASTIPMPESQDIKLESSDLRLKLENKKNESTASDTDKSKGKIQIKNLKFSAVYEETVKKAEEEARKKAKMYEEGEYSDTSSDSEKADDSNSQFPKTSDPGGILKKQVEDESKLLDEEKSHSKKSKHSDKDKHSESSRKSRRDRSRSPIGSKSKSHRSRSRSSLHKYHSSSSKTLRRSRSRHRSSSRSRRRSTSRTRRRHEVPLRLRGRRSRSPTGVKLADSEKKRLLEVARRNAINMLKNGAVPAGAAALPPHTRNQVMAAIQSGGKSVDELTDFCKHLSKKEALGELSSVSSGDEGASENEDTKAFHHPFLVKEKAPIVMNIRGGVPLPVKSTALVPIANKEELTKQFPVSSGTQHRENAIEWVPVSPKKTDNNQVAKLNSKPDPKPAAAAAAPEPKKPATTGPLPLPAPLPAPPPAPELLPLSDPEPVPEPPPFAKNFTSGTQLSTVPALKPPPMPAPELLAGLPPPGPQAYPPGLEPPKIDYASIVSQKIAMIRKEQEKNEIPSMRGFGWSKNTNLGQFTGSTGAQILTPRELASGLQAWAKKDQLQRAAPVEGGMGMALLQKMGWTPGRGLGKEGTGALQPLLLEVKLDTKGLQAKEEAAGRGKGMRGQRPGRRGPAPLVAGGKHPVSLLGEYCSKNKLGPPEYNLCFECGPDHKKNFLFRVKVAGTEYQPAVASANKKQAKADAAQLALQKLGITT